MSRAGQSNPAARAKACAACCAFVALAFAASVASAQDGSARRRALVVGNDAYVGQSALSNAVNDARAVTSALEAVGFEVTRVEDATRARLAEALGAFAGSLGADDVALFYFAGHGVQIDQENYLIPTDFAGGTATAVRLNALSAVTVERELQRARMAMLVLDACRNNPYLGTRSGGAGLAAREPPQGTLIAYAASAGQLAADEAAPGADNGLFTAKFVEALRAPGLTARDLFQQVRREVYVASNEAQFPAVYDALLNDFVFRSAPDPSGAGGPSPAAVETSTGGDPSDRESDRARLAALLGRDLSPSRWDENGWTDLHYAAALDLPYLIRELVAGGAVVDARLYVDSEPVSDRVWETLNRFAGGRDFKSVNSNMHTRYGSTPLHAAAAFNSRQAVAELLRLGADIEATDDLDHTPLHNAAYADAVETATELIGRSADVNALAHWGRISVLREAAEGNARQVVALLLDRGANIEATNERGGTALHGASETAVALLLDHGANIEATDDGGQTALHVAATSSREWKPVALLLDRGANINATDSNGWTPLHGAAWNGVGETAVLLLDRGANIHAADKSGRTPLHRTVDSDNRETARILLDRGARVDATADGGYTPLHYAAWVNATSVAELLIDRGASINAQASGRTPLAMVDLGDSSGEGDDAMRELLRRHGAR